VTYEVGLVRAAGFVMSDGTVTTNFNIVSCSWDVVHSCYRITIGEENYFYNQYVTIVTVSEGNVGQFATTNSLTGDLLVFIWGPNA
jgi:hypothetical protein